MQQTYTSKALYIGVRRKKKERKVFRTKISQRKRTTDIPKKLE